jgi:hypothetical protein
MIFFSMRYEPKRAVAARKRVRAQGYSKIRGSFYRLRRKVRGGGEAGSNTKELAEEEKEVVGGPIRRGEKIAIRLGRTKVTAPVTIGFLGGQHATLQSIADFRP